MSRWVRAGRKRGWDRAIAGSAACLVLVLSGCGGRDRFPSVKTYEVTGKVLLADGKPLTTGRVYFVPEGDPAVGASGELGLDGSFRLTTLSPGDGAAAGTYRVRIELEPRAGRTARPPVPPKYIDESSSGLVVAVKAEPNPLEPFRLK